MKKVLSVLLSLALLLGITSSLNFTAFASSYKNGQYITFGSYPQSKVTDKSTVNALNALEKNWESYNYYYGPDSSNEENEFTFYQGDFMQYADVSYNGAKYRAVKFSNVRPSYGNDKLGKSKKNSNGYKINTIYYFKYEPIIWKILDKSKGLAVSELVLDSQAFNNTYYIDYNSKNNVNYKSNDRSVYADDYSNSDIRAWLNNDFLNAGFNESEQNTLVASPDKVTLLSKSDAKNYFKTDDSRTAIGTNYAEAQGLWVLDYVDSDGGEDALGHCYYMLRSPSDDKYYKKTKEYTYGVHPIGFCSDGYAVYENCYGIRPVISLDLKNGSFPTYTYKLPKNCKFVNDEVINSKLKKTDFSSVTPGKKSVKVAWKSVKGVKDYEVQIASDKKFTKNVETQNSVMLYFENNSTVFTNLKTKNCFVRVRTFKLQKINGKTSKVYSPWSKVKSVKTK